MAIVTSYTVTSSRGPDYFTETQLSRRSRLNRFAAQVKALAGGIGGGLTTRTTVRAGTAQATATVTCATVVVDNTVTINGTALTAKQKNATATATFASCAVDDTITINGVAFTAKATADFGARQFSQGGTDTQDAASFAACVNACQHTSIKDIVTVKSSAAVATVRAYTPGTGGNALTFVSSNGTRLAVTGSGTLANGAAAANNHFDCTGTDTETAAALAAAIDASTTSIVSDICTATSAAAICTVKSRVKGTAGNAITLASSGSTVAVSGARLTGGTDDEFTF